MGGACAVHGLSTPAGSCGTVHGARRHGGSSSGPALAPGLGGDHVRPTRASRRRGAAGRRPRPGRAARVLNERGRATKRHRARNGNIRKARSWTKEAVLRVVKNAIYAGFMPCGDEVHPGEHDAIVPEEKWRRAQAMLRNLPWVRSRLGDCVQEWSSYLPRRRFGSPRPRWRSAGRGARRAVGSPASRSCVCRSCTMRFKS